MKHTQFYNPIGLVILIFTFMFSACESSTSNHEHVEEEESLQTYTCPMHPQVVQNTPGTCPVCSMDLVPFDKDSEGSALVIDKTRQALANITTSTVGENLLATSKQLNGRLIVNPDQTNY